VTESLLATKLYIPATRPELVKRARLVEMLNRGLHRKLTLISAPAGFGKTTLVTEWVAGLTEDKVAGHRGIKLAWLSLDEGDNDPARFLEYFITALSRIQGLDPPIGEHELTLLRSSHPPTAESILTSIINQISVLNQKILFVLEDYHLVETQPIENSVNFWIENIPPQIHQVIITREDPNIPLGKLRAGDQITELRANDLRFTEAEAAQFLNEVMGLCLDERSISALEQRTEGWVVGLQMAALSMRERKNDADFIEGFSGTNRYILDYLLEEVLASQPEEIQQFLLETSILERLTAPLCDALLVDSAKGRYQEDHQTAPPKMGFPNPSETILERLEQANLFVVPMDDRRLWYRYHHLFADLLRAQLRKLRGAETVARLHLLAAKWFENNGSVLEAIHHATLAPDAEQVERIIQHNYMELVSRGEISRLRYWIGKLSRELVFSRPWLCLFEAYSQAWFGDLAEADLLLGEAENHAMTMPPSPESQSLHGHLAYIKSRVTAMRGDIPAAIDYCLQARQYVPEDNLAMQLDTRITLGYEHYLQGDFSEAVNILNETIAIGSDAGAVIDPVAASCVLARLFTAQGKLHTADAVLRKAIHFLPNPLDHHLGAGALIDVGIADLEVEWNQLEDALAHLHTGLANMQMWDKADDLAFGFATLAKIHLAQANPAEAAETIEKAKRLLQTRGVFSEVRRVVESVEVRIWLAQNDSQAALRWAAPLYETLKPEAPLEFVNELTHISLARVLVAQEKPEDAATLLAKLAQDARSNGRNGRLLTILALQSLVQGQLGQIDQAHEYLFECLALSEPQGYLRTFLDEGPPMRKLLAGWLSQAKPGRLRDYTARLIPLFDTETRPGEDGEITTEDTLVEPLTAREVEILQQIALGKTNKEIAAHFVLSPGTVKAHTSSIYRKLAVSNRTEAVARGRQLGFLS
jgi:LuxR family maltose regulon positive regulatory protein